MEVKRGYKQTEVGTIPKDWEVHCLRAISSQITDGDHVTPKRVRVGYYLLSARNVRDGRLDLSDVDYVGPAEFNRMRLRCAPLPSDILVSCSGHGLGRVSMVPAGLQCVLVRSAALVKVNRKNADSSFVHYWLRSAHAQNQISIQISRAAQPNLFLNNIEKLLTPLPPTKAEQEAIAEALSDADAHIESLEQLIAKKRQIKQGAMQELLTGKKRLPGFNGEWEVKRLGEVCDITMGRTPSRLNPTYWGAGYKWLSIADLKAKVVAESNEEITQSAAAEMLVIRKGTLLMSFKLSIGRLCFAGCDLYTNEAICSFNNLKANAEFMYYMLGRTDFSLYGKQAVKGYTLNKESLKLVEIFLPSQEEQTAIATILSDMDTELAALEVKLAKACQLKQGMMQELLTGRVRLVPPAVAA